MRRADVEGFCVLDCRNHHGEDGAQLAARCAWEKRTEGGGEGNVLFGGGAETGTERWGRSRWSGLSRR